MTVNGTVSINIRDEHLRHVVVERPHRFVALKRGAVSFVRAKNGVKELVIERLSQLVVMATEQSAIDQNPPGAVAGMTSPVDGLSSRSTTPRAW